MHGIENNRRILAAFFLLLTFLPAVFAQLAVSVKPAEQNHASGLYTNEIREFSVLAVNLSNDRLVGEKFRVIPSSELVLLQNGSEVFQQDFLVAELLPNQATELHISAKARSNPAPDATLSVRFGQTVLTDLAAVSFPVLASPLDVQLRLQQSELALGGHSTLFASFENNSKKPLFNIRSELIGSSTVDSLSKSFELLELAPGKKTEARAFEFWPRPLALGKNDVVLHTDFSDASGFHRLEHRVVVQVRDAGSTAFFWLFIFGMILVIYLVWIQTQSKPSKKTTKITIEKTETKK